MRGELPGSAHQFLPDGVTFLDAKPAVFEAMLDGWATQQRARFLKAKTIEVRLGLLRRFAVFTNDYPWAWACADVEAFISDRRQSAQLIAMSTARMYEITIRMFLTYVTDPRYGWIATCEELFGTAPQQILHEWNTIVHTSEYEGAPHRRPLSYDEIQALFDAADGRAEAIPGTGRKGALTAQRDAALLKMIYAFGLRRQEAWGLDVTDLRHNPTTPGYRDYGALFVRFGKASRGGTAKRRTVLTVPEMDWIVPVLEHWRNEVRPLLGCRAHPALWVTERSDRISMRRINEAFTTARDAAGLDPVLDLHCLRPLMAERGHFATTDLVPLLADRGIHLSREQVYRLVTTTPQRLNLDVLAALCDILDVDASDLIEITTASTTVNKPAGATETAHPPPVRRTTIRRPTGS